MNRTLGSLATTVAALCAIVALTFMSLSGTWLLLVLWTAGLSMWTANGWKNIPLGSRGMLTVLGERSDIELKEGWRWAPFPFAIEIVTTKETFLELPPLTATTADNVGVTIEATVAYRQANLAKAFDVQDMKKGLGDARSQAIRVHVKNTPLEEVLKMHEELGRVTKRALSERAEGRWGIEIFEVLVPKITPEKQVGDDLALKERENLQRKGQEVELAHFIAQVKRLMDAGLSREQAIEQVQMALGKATKNVDAKTITVDKTTAEILAGVFGGRR